MQAMALRPRHAPLTPIDIRSSPTFPNTRVAVVTPATDERGDPIGRPIDPRANQISAREVPCPFSFHFPDGLICKLTTSTPLLPYCPILMQDFQEPPTKRFCNTHLACDDGSTPEVHSTPAAVNTDIFLILAEGRPLQFLSGAELIGLNFFLLFECQQRQRF
ncbi:hypothetical protein ElyMa_003190600 [Elysia marginata]|uniref:Uncharacterized protein n=1 Tax=Elysia marginata TaxID=1093978 RepID=A0AAV4J0R2_9GAST|nr:hypothetical protein ElyMa_003190600 [Elysia marginata]